MVIVTHIYFFKNKKKIQNGIFIKNGLHTGTCAIKNKMAFS